MSGERLYAVCRARQGAKREEPQRQGDREGHRGKDSGEWSMVSEGSCKLYAARCTLNSRGKGILNKEQGRMKEEGKMQGTRFKKQGTREGHTENWAAKTRRREEPLRILNKEGGRKK
ncbi:hypothetical protein SY85_14775 [Flavisolibacter tropicus]|uniref:Uncharacterized protein n=1 Tax=Flavisolibacter tropicus TaxID=1492898 RepID=A0A172TWU1_9BACT|nr:hypothetical protein SY85_14775 [Flavisolibacter tropicus]